MSKKTRASKQKVKRAARRSAGVTAKNKIAKLERHLRKFPNDKQTIAALEALNGTWTPSSGRRSNGNSVEMRVKHLHDTIDTLRREMREVLATKKGKEKSDLEEKYRGKLSAANKQLANLLGVTVPELSLPKGVRDKHGKVDRMKELAIIAGK